MKKSLFQTLLFGLLILLGQCTYDQAPQPTPSPAAQSLSANQELSGEEQQAARQLAANRDFKKLVMTANGVTDVLYNNLRDARSEKVRTANLNRVRSLLNSQDNADSLRLAIRKMGFNDLRRFATDMHQIASAKAGMSQAGLGLEKVPLSVMTVAVGMVSKEAGYDYPNTTNMSEVCPLCFFNNCSECNDGTEVETPSPGDGGNGSNTCWTEAEIIRQSARNQAVVIMAAALGGCGWTAIEIDAWTTGIAIGTGPLAPVIGAGAGGIYVVGCSGLVIFNFASTLDGIESAYRTATAACRN